MEPNRDIVVRKATEDDFDAIANVWRQSALAMDGKPDVPSTEQLRERIDAELQSEWELHVALLNERVVGMLALRPHDATLDQIFVLPSEQGKGVGAALLDLAKQAMPVGFTLRMAAGNEQAKRFYEKQGMEWLRDGIHPWTGIPVRFYGWNVRQGSKGA